MILGKQWKNIVIIHNISKRSKLTLYNVFSPVIWFLCRQDWMDDDFFSEALDGKIEAVEFIL